jgi:hypothetical protein
LILDEDTRDLEEEFNVPQSKTFQTHINWARQQDKDDILQFWKKKVRVKGDQDRKTLIQNYYCIF